VPNVVGDTRSQALAAMGAAGLYVYTSGPGAGTTRWKKVVSEIPAAETTVKVGSYVSLNVTE
jgi:beta-lactam-binding protein with PASTA domain